MLLNKQGAPLIVAVDTETNGLDTEKCRAFCATTCDQYGNTNFYDFRNAPLHTGLQEVLKGARCIFHNAKFDIKMLENAGYPRPTLFEDTIIMAFLANPDQPLNLDALGHKYVKERKYIDPTFDLWRAKNKKDIKENGYANVPHELLKKYAIHDASLTIKLYYALCGVIKYMDMGQVYELEKRFLLSLIECERRGIFIDMKFLFQTLSELLPILDSIEKMVVQKGITNIKSHPQVRRALTTEYKGLVIIDSTARKTLEKLEELGFGLPKLISKHRRISGIVSKVLNPTLEKMVPGKPTRLHTTFNQCTARTGRISSSNINMQNLLRVDPRDPLTKIPRRLVIPSPGMKLVGADYDQEEMRIIADESEDENLVRLLNSGGDPYINIAKKIFKTDEIDKRKRYIAKQSVLGISYYMGPKRFVAQAEQYGVTVTYDEAHYITWEVKEEFPGIRERADKYLSEGQQKGYVQDRYGRKYIVPKDKAYIAFNKIIQGTAATIMKKAWIEIDKYGPPDFFVILCVHDEFLAETTRDIESANQFLVDCMTVENSRFPNVKLSATPKRIEYDWASVK